MRVSYFFIFVFLNFNVYKINSFLNIFARSELNYLKERCGQSVLLNNNYWLLKQTHYALTAVTNGQITLDNLPWDRLSRTVQQIYNACSIDEMKQSKERMKIHQATLNAGSRLAKEAKDMSHPSLIKLYEND